jgi:hypothetical protein
VETSVGNVRVADPCQELGDLIAQYGHAAVDRPDRGRPPTCTDTPCTASMTSKTPSTKVVRRCPCAVGTAAGEDEAMGVMFTAAAPLRS